MALVIGDRVKESSITTGTGSYTLAGAEAGFQSFAVIGNGNTTYYAATDGTDWEVGIGTYNASGTTLSRDTIISSSATGSAVNWGGGEKLVFCTLPASKAPVLNSNGRFEFAEVEQYFDIHTTSTPAHQEGRIFYDTTNKALAVYNDEADVTLQVGQEQWARVYNNTGSTVTNGTPVYISGASLDTPTIALADASSATAFDVVGLATHDIENNSYGYITLSGLVRDVDTSAYSVGDKLFVSTTAGELTDVAPSYPNYPMSIANVVKVGSTDGIVDISRGLETVGSFRVVSNAHVGNNLVVGGDLTVQGAQIVASSENVAIGAAFQYLNAGDTIGEANTSFTGAGVDDAYLSGHYTGPDTRAFYVQIDGAKTGPNNEDTFKWSYNSDLSSPEATGVVIQVGDNALAYGISINFATDTNHTVGNTWYGTAAPLNTDTGVFTNYNTGSTGVGYTHTGFFWDSSAQKWTLLSRYDPEPTGDINLSAANTTFATLKLGTVEGDLQGSLIGNADTASQLATPRQIALTGDVSGSVNFDGSQNVSITATVANDSHTHSDYVQKTGDTMTGTLTTPSVSLGDWTITDGAGTLYFEYQGVKKFSLDSSGTLSVTNDVLTDATIT